MSHQRTVTIAVLFALAGVASQLFGQGNAPVARNTLDIYVTDTEGGKATLFVAPSGETVLVDTGNPGARDLDRILEVFEVAGVTKIDYLISTHYHTDHIGGLTAIAERIPVAHFIQRKPEPASPDDNAQSVGSVIAFGQFRVLDLGDLLWNNEFDLACPRNVVGTVDLYLVTHHGLDRSGAPQLVKAVRPRVAVMSNGTRKGGAIASFQTLRASPGLEDIWTSHWSYAGGVEHNSPGVFIANLDSMPTIAAVITSAPDLASRGNAAHSPSHWIKISAQDNGTFTVTNSRNAFSRTYVKR